MLLCGVYNPPKPKYVQDDLIDYVTDIVDDFLETYPDGLVVCGGDLNRLDLDKLSTLSGLKVLVDFPTRGDAILDNCLTNNETLFSKCYPIVAQMKTDHKGFILPAGVKLKPLRIKRTMRDYREHRKIAFHRKLLKFDWHPLTNNNNLEAAVESVHSTITKFMDECFPAKTVCMSSRDPPWMTPLLKFILKKKARSERNGGRDWAELSSKADKLIQENRRALASGPLGSRAWWRKVDFLS
mgnify:FL=1